MSESKNKRSFLLYLDYKEQFDLLNDEQLGQLLRVIMEYEETGNVPKIDGMIKMAFSFIKAQLDRDQEKYEEKCQKNRENGSRGGRPKKEETEEENEKEEKTERFR